MKLPAFLYGRGRDARCETKKIITRLRRGLALPEAVDDVGGLIEVEDNPGWIILGGPDPVGGSRDGFHLYRLLVELQEHHYDDLVQPLENELFETLVTREWGVALLLSSRGRLFVSNHAQALANGRYHRLLDAACEHWPAFEAVGPRWSASGSQLGRPLPCSRTLEIVLLRCNISYEAIQAGHDLGLPELLHLNPPEPEKYEPPRRDVQTATIERRARIIEGYRILYRRLGEHRLPTHEAKARRLTYDRDLRAKGLDPADVDPYWHQRPGFSGTSR